MRKNPNEVAAVGAASEDVPQLLLLVARHWRANGRLLKLARLRAGLSQRELAEKLECTHTWVGRMERGEVLIPDATRERLLNLLVPKSE